MRHAWVNTALLVLVPTAFATGVLGLLGGSLGGQLTFLVHGAAAYAIVALLLWKCRVIVAGLRRRPGRTVQRRAFLLLLALLLFILASGIGWVLAGPRGVGGISLINWHAYAATVLIAILAWHVVAHRRVLRSSRARDRAAFLRLAGALGAGYVLLRLERGVEAVAGTSVRRRFTGSYEIGSDGGAFPATSWLNDDPDPVDAAAWRLVVDGHVDRPATLSLADLAALPAAAETATLDCTGGWYTRQRWSGVRLATALAAAGVRPGARSVRVVGTTGYDRRFSLDDTDRLLLATHVGTTPLDHGHGAPLRLVAPGRRGFAWVKWVDHVEVSTDPAWLQAPLPLQ